MKFTIEEFRNYLESQDSLGDIHYFLNEANIIKANDSEDLLNTDIEDIEDDEDDSDVMDCPHCIEGKIIKNKGGLFCDNYRREK